MKSFFQTIVLSMLMKTSYSYTGFIMLAVAVVLSGCQTQKTATTTEAPQYAPPPAANPSAAENAPAAAQPASAAPAAGQPAALSLVNGAYRVKAGSGTPMTDSEGRVWQPDQGFDGGDVIDRDPDTKVTGTTDPAMFLSEHYGMEAFSAKIPNGKYTANLYFAETFDGIAGPGQRVFSFNVQGHEYKNFDLWVVAGGPDKAYTVTVPVEVTNGIFRIDFTTQVENPEINAIELIPNP
jgi:hypothetical protein